MAVAIRAPLRTSAPQLPALTGLRFFAALLVLLIHFGQGLLPGDFWHDITMNGAQGVSLFFVLSGFILTYTYADAHGFVGSKRSYFVARVARIYPVYLLTLGVALPLLFAVNHYQGPRTLPLALVVGATLTMTQGWVPWGGATWNGVAWTLSVEACFYVVLPFVIPAVARLRGRPVLAGLALAVLATQIAPELYVLAQPDRGGGDADFGYWVAALWYNPLVFLPTFMVGVFLARLHRERTRHGVPRWAGPASLCAVALTLLALSWSYLWVDPIRLHTGLLAPFFGVLVATLAWGRGPVAWLCSTRLLQLLGNASYALYLLQFGLWSWVGIIGWAPQGTRGTLAFLLALIVLSCLVYRWYEQPLRRHLRRLAN